MADSDKNILVTPNSGSTDDPNIVFVGSSGSVTGTVTIKAYAYDSGTVSFEGLSGQIFSVSSASVDPIFSVGDVSGIPVIQIFSSGLVSVGLTSGTLLTRNLVMPAYLTGNVPAAPLSGSGSIFVRKRAGRDVPCFDPSSGSENLMQPHMGVQNQQYLEAGPASTTIFSGSSAISSTGTLNSRAIAGTNLSTSVKRIGYSTAAAAGSAAGIWTSSALYSRGDVANAAGFFAALRFVPATVPASSRFFAGFYTGTLTPANVQPSSLLSICGVGKDSGDTNLQFMHNDGTGTATKVDSGITLTAAHLMEMRIYCPPGGSNIFMSLESVTSGNFAEYDSAGSTDIPATTAIMGFRAYIMTTTNNITALDISSLYIDSDY